MTLKWNMQLPPAFTLCWATRYGSDSQMHQVLHDTFGSVYGHKQTNGIIITDMDWLIQCFKNGNDDDEVVIDQELVDNTNTVEIVNDTPRYLRINDNENYGMNSAFHVHSVYIFYKHLVVDKMKIITAALRSELGGRPYGGLDEVVPMSNIRMYNKRIEAAIACGVSDECEHRGDSCIFEYPPLETRADSNLQYLSYDQKRVWIDTTKDSTPYAPGTYVVEQSSITAGVPVALPPFLSFFLTARPISVRCWASSTHRKVRTPRVAIHGSTIYPKQL
jgi:hypothetical protein